MTRRALPLAARTNGQRTAFRARLARALYRRTSFPFRMVFQGVAALRRTKHLQCLSQGDSDSYLAAHTQTYFRKQWLYGYHRVFDLVSHFQPVEHPASLKVLSLGPRTEVELYYLWLFCGFSWDKMVGLDLVSRSTKILLGDMSVELPFEDKTFDVIVASHCLEKSRSHERTRDEIRRVSKPGARMLVGGDRQCSGSKCSEWRMPVQLFDDGVYGLIDVYQVNLEDIEYMNARSPHGFEIIFKVRSDTE